ncbi:MAG: PIN domain-containing protein [Nitrospirota bacterium]
MKILKSLKKLTVDANPILSAIIGGIARDVFLKTEMTSFYTTAFNFKEVERYIPVLSAGKGIPAEDLYLALSTLPLFVCNKDFYKSQIKKAQALIGKRDPDDIHLLALALELKCPIWSNDKDFEGLGIDVYRTLDLIKD